MTSRRRAVPGQPITRRHRPPAPSPIAPVNNVPANTTTFTNTAKVFSQQNANAITISDADSRSVTTVVSTDKGTIEVIPNSGVVITGNKTLKATITGSPTNINRALDGLIFQPSTGVTGAATIVFRTSDGTTIDTDSFTVTISGTAPAPPPSGSPPVNSIPGPQTVVSSQNLIFNSTRLISISDTDSTSVSTTISVFNGKMSVSTSGGATVLGNNSSQVTISGTPGQINSALNGAVFTSNAGFVGTAQITVSTTDGTSTDSDIISVNVTTSGAPAPAPGPATAPFYPLGSRIDLISGKYPYGSVVNNRTASAMDADLRNKYIQWRAARVYNVPGISGAKAVKFTDASYPGTSNALTVSEGMGYGMLLAVLYEDQATFDGLFTLVRARPAYSVPTNRNGAHLYLMDWKLGPNGESSSSYGGGWPATDGDLDIAQALLMAYRQWGTTGTTKNYSQEAKNTIGAIKSWYFNSTDVSFGSSGSDVSRLSDYMYGHFRSFASATGDTWWTANALVRAKAITDKCQTVFSAANSGPGCFVPDAVVNTDGSLSSSLSVGMNPGGTWPNNVTNFPAAFGVPAGAYGSGANNYTPSPGGRLDFTPTEMHHYVNSQRCGFRWGADSVFSGDAVIKEQCNRQNRFVPGFLNNNPASCPIGFRLNAGLQGPQGGGLSMGTSWPARGMVQGFMNAAQVDPAYQTWLNACYDYLFNNWVTSYYDCELMLLGMTMAAGDWWTYPGGGGGGGGGGSTLGPVNTVPGAQTMPVGGTKVFNSANANVVSVSDPDSVNLTTIVSAVHGTLKATQNAGGGALADGFPAKVVYGYWPGWGGQSLISVSQNYNVISLFAARNAGSNVGDGSVTWEWPGYPSQADVQTVRARGQKVILAIGGSGHGYLYNTRGKSTAFVNSLISIINAFGGIDGVDYNFFEGSVVDASTQTVMAGEMVWISQQLKAQYGANFGIVSPPQPNDPVQQYLMQQLAIANCLTWCNPQYYDWSGFKAVGFISGLSGGTNRNQTWVNLIGQSRVAVGLSANYDYTNSLTLAEANREMDVVLAAYPNIRGVSAWNTETDAAGGNAFANNFKSKFGSDTGGGQAGATVTNNNSTSVTIAGTIANVNASLNGLLYTPTQSYAGSDVITVSTSDGVYSDTDTIPITISSPTPAPAPQSNIPFKMGVNAHTGGSSASNNTLIVNTLAARGIKVVRLDLYGSSNLTDFITKCVAAGIRVQGIIYTRASGDNTVYTGGALTTWENNNYADAAAFVDTYYVLGVRDFETLNEVTLRPECTAQVAAYGAGNVNEATYTGKTAFISIAAALRGIANAIHAKASDCRVIMGTIGRDWGYAKYMKTLGVNFDLLGYHNYPDWNNANVLTDTWYGTGGAAAQLAAINKPVTWNEFNASEIYDGGYTNVDGSTLVEEGFKGNKLYLDRLVAQTQFTLDSLVWYELWDEPSKSAPENRFGLVYNQGTMLAVKASFLIATAYAGGTLSAGERNTLISKGIMTDQEITALQPSATPPPPPPAPSGASKIGVNHHNVLTTAMSAGERTTMASMMNARGIKFLRMELPWDAAGGTVTAARDLITKTNANGCKTQIVVMTSFQFATVVNTDLTAVETQAYNEATTLINQLSDIVTDFEILNETQLHTLVTAEVTWNNPSGSAGWPSSTYVGKPGCEMAGSASFGIYRAINDKRASSGRPLRVISECIGRDFQWMNFLYYKGVRWDVTAWHIYPTEGNASLQSDTWYGTNGPLYELGLFGKPVSIGEFNAGEMYDLSYTNVEGGTLVEAGFRSVVKHMKEILTSTQCVIESIIFYEWVDEPSKPAPEGVFGVLPTYAGTPKVTLLLMAAFAGAGAGLTSGERTRITSRTGLLTSGEIDAYAAGTSAPPPPPPPPAGQTGADVLLSYFGSGNQGAWLDPQPVSNFNTSSSSGVALTAYGNFFGRWKDRSGRVHDLVEIDDFSRPSAISDGLGIHADIYDRAPIQSAGGINGAFYLCVVQQLDLGTYYGSWISDRTSSFNGVQLGHDADQAGSGLGDVYVSVGNGTQRVIVRCKSDASDYTSFTGKHVIEAWWEGPGQPLVIRFDKGTGSKTGSGALGAVSQGGPDMLLGADSATGGDWMIAKYFQVIVLKNQCPTTAERDLIATWAAARAGLTM